MSSGGVFSFSFFVSLPKKLFEGKEQQMRETDNPTTQTEDLFREKDQRFFVEAIDLVAHLIEVNQSVYSMALSSN